MVATQIFTEKSSVETNQFKGFANLIYAGLCNQADRKDRQRPFYEEAYDLAMEIVEQGEELQTQIYEAWASTKPAKAMVEKLQEYTGEAKKKTDVKAKGKTGTK